LKLWNTNPIFALRTSARSFASRLDTSTPSKTYRPEVGRSRQPRRFISVDFPDPDGPMIATNSPFAIDSDTPSNARISKSPIA
jgi:hypothetical protein